MNMLVDGEWQTDAYQTTNEDGAFERQTTSFRDRIEDEPDARFRPEADRYHLYVCRACPWAHRTLITRTLKGLEDTITVDYVDPYRGDDGWQFTPEKDGCTPDTVNGADYLREVYVEADPDMTGRVTVPVLWDKQEDTIVNNESAEIMRMLDTEFDDVAENDVDLYPEGYREEVDRLIEAIYEPINNGVYRTGFADSQAAYDEAVEELFDALDHWDSVLADQRYLAGDRLTEADVAMFTTLVRFDEVYHTIPTTLSKVSNSIQDTHPEKWRRIRDYEHLHPYLRDLYQTDGIADTVNMAHIVEHYASPGSPQLHTPNPEDIEMRLDEPHDRDRLPTVPLE
ncbi:glutathione S-transferase family protein [Halorhabdus amylolytica]|uniref:glutathione S-transferase family protein n=1 Tax=Halorhabdus amylolytica TaxID=2559573 RepID=UPI0010AA4C8A|nr:glutathione S-transferase family protein [Halorhabdus amylolytica]